jgi:hypothetical protein
MTNEEMPLPYPKSISETFFGASSYSVPRPSKIILRMATAIEKGAIQYRVEPAQPRAPLRFNHFTSQSRVQ